MGGFKDEADVFAAYDERMSQTVGLQTGLGRFPMSAQAVKYSCIKADEYIKRQQISGRDHDPSYVQQQELVQAFNRGASMQAGSRASKL